MHIHVVSREISRGDGEKEARRRNIRYPVGRIYRLCDRQRSRCRSIGGARSGLPQQGKVTNLITGESKVSVLNHQRCPITTRSGVRCIYIRVKGQLKVKIQCIYMYMYIHVLPPSTGPFQSVYYKMDCTMSSLVTAPLPLLECMGMAGM